jgi:hypothetical protein
MAHPVKWRFKKGGAENRQPTHEQHPQHHNTNKDSQSMFSGIPQKLVYQPKIDHPRRFFFSENEMPSPKPDIILNVRNNGTFLVVSYTLSLRKPQAATRQKLTEMRKRLKN